MKRKLFGTDGVRGLANQFPMDPGTALELGQAIAYFFKGRGGNRHRIVIGKDTRLSGYMLENALSSGICSMGAEAIFLGPLPTPGIAFITRAMRADAGVVISASHNPFYDNGIKFFDHQGYKLPDEIEMEIEKLMESKKLKNGPTHGQVGKAYRVDDAAGRYIEHVKSKFPEESSLEGIRVALDCAHGAAYHVAPIVLEELGAEVIPMGIEPNGLNINDGCGALYPEKLQEKVRRTHAHLGIALDGDADRLVMVDEKAELVHGDSLIAMMAKDLFEAGKLARNTVVVTVMSNLGLELAMQEIGIHTLRVQVGDRYIMEAIRREQLNFGGEQSGHLIFHEHSTTGDGILAALQVLALMKKRRKPLSELAHGITILPQVLLNVRVSKKKDLDSLPGLKSLRQKIHGELGKRGRMLLRYSGTEPVLRIMLEGEDPEKIRSFAQEVREDAERELGKGE